MLSQSLMQAGCYRTRGFMEVFNIILVSELPNLRFLANLSTVPYFSQTLLLVLLQSLSSISLPFRYPYSSRTQSYSMHNLGYASILGLPAGLEGNWRAAMMLLGQARGETGKR